eukprot:scaffold33608_cov49-Isochrysis_galbana.AAC.1
MRWAEGVRTQAKLCAGSKRELRGAIVYPVGERTRVVPHDETLIVRQPPVSVFCFRVWGGGGRLCGGEGEQVGVAAVGRVQGVAELH